MSQPNQPPWDQKGGQSNSSNKQQPPKKVQRVEDKYQVIPLPLGPQYPPTGAAGGQMTQQRFHYSSPYQSLQYQYYHNMQNNVPHYPQYAMPQVAPPAPYPMPYPYYQTQQPQMATNYSSNYSMHASAGYGYGYNPFPAQGPVGPPGQQYRPQQQQPEQEKMAEEKPSTNDDQLTKKLDDMDRDMKNMLQMLQRKNCQTAAARPTAAPAQTNLNIEQFNQALNQFHKLAQTVQQLKQQPQHKPPPSSADHLYHYNPQRQQPQQAKPSSMFSGQSPRPNSSVPPPAHSQTMSYQFGAPSPQAPPSSRSSNAEQQLLQQKYNEAFEIYRKMMERLRKEMNATANKSAVHSLTLNDSPCPNMGPPPKAPSKPASKPSSVDKCLKKP